MSWPRLWWPTGMLQLINPTNVSIHYDLKQRKKNLEFFGPHRRIDSVQLWFDYIILQKFIIDYV
jgi:hypothetical protein